MYPCTYITIHIGSHPRAVKSDISVTGWNLEVNDIGVVKGSWAPPPLTTDVENAISSTSIHCGLSQHNPRIFTNRIPDCLLSSGSRWLLLLLPLVARKDPPKRCVRIHKSCPPAPCRMQVGELSWYFLGSSTILMPS